MNDRRRFCSGEGIKGPFAFGRLRNKPYLKIVFGKTAQRIDLQLDTFVIRRSAKKYISILPRIIFSHSMLNCKILFRVKFCGKQNNKKAYPQANCPLSPPLKKSSLPEDIYFIIFIYSSFRYFLCTIYLFFTYNLFHYFLSTFYSVIFIYIYFIILHKNVPAFILLCFISSLFQYLSCTIHFIILVIYNISFCTTLYNKCAEFQIDMLPDFFPKKVPSIFFIFSGAPR